MTGDKSAIKIGDNILQSAKKSADNEEALIKSADNEKASIKSADNNKKALIKSPVQKELIIAYLTDHAGATGAELGELLALRPTRVRTLLRELAAEGIVVAEGGNRNRTYRLKS